MRRKDLFDMLSSHKVLIGFNKVDGTFRRMTATLSEDVTGAPPKIDGNEDDVSGLISVYDIENSGWRSFYLENINSAEIV